MEKTWSSLTVTTVNSIETESRALVDVTIESTDGEYEAIVDNVLVGRLLTSDSDTPPSKRDTSTYTHMNDITFKDYPAKVEMIISAAHADAWMGLPGSDNFRQGPQKQPMAMKTKFGWTLLGACGKKKTDRISCYRISVDDASIKADVDRIFYNDFTVISEEEMGESRDHRYATQQLEETIKKDETAGKYSVGLPWKYGREETIKIINGLNSRAMCLKRLHSMVPRLKRDEGRKERVFAEMNKFEEKGYAVPIKDDKNDSGAENARWYLPIHVVEKWIEDPENHCQKLKTRVCHDARASVNGFCLNDFLLGGPNTVCPLPDILLNFRVPRVAITADIESFFHNVLVDLLDADAFRYFWFKDDKFDEVKLLRFLAHVFGSGASSFVTSFVLRYHAELLKSTLTPDVYEAIRHKFYVDDFTGGQNDIPSAKIFVKQLTAAMKIGGFPLAKWKSNYPEIFDDDDSTDDKQDKTKQLGSGDEETTTKVLGVGWNPSLDIFTFTFDETKFDRDVRTPRALVSVQASLFDPLGFISPFQLIGRRLLQRATAKKAGWDSWLNEQVRTEFARWAQSIRILAQYSIPRWWDTEQTFNSRYDQLHVFGDASKDGYGAVAYRRVVGHDNSIHVTILLARSHVVPLNPSRASHHNEIPRLEMVAAVKTVEVRRYLERALKHKFSEVILWSDSTSVLKQIFNRKTKLKSFYANRVSKISGGSSVNEWRSCPGKLNTADLCSRGIQAHESEKWHRFFHGPEFLHQTEEHWPEMTVSRDPSPATTVFSFAVSTTTTPKDAYHPAWQIASSCSSWMGKLRRIAIFKKFIKLWRQKANNKQKFVLVINTHKKSSVTKDAPPDWSLNRADFDAAERLLIQDIQDKHFGEEKTILIDHNVHQPDSRKEVNVRKSKISRHNPFVDDDDIIRIGSRLVHASINEETKYPIILPRDDPNVRDLIRHHHLQEIHAGPRHVLCQIRQRFWILQGLQEVRKVTNRCITCQKRFKAPLQQQMAPLPEARVSIGAPFDEAGLDMAGPFIVKKIGRATHKVYLALFSCMKTRAIHLEVVYQMDAASLIDAIARFSARRPGLRRLVSDRGTNFTAADKILKREMATWNASLTNQLQRKGLSWSFILPGSPHLGGFYERSVGLVKRHLKAATNGDVINIKTFETMIVEIEAIVNRRPLTALSADSRDVEAITPAHILYPATYAHSSARIVPYNVSTDADRLRTMWKRTQSRVNAFWKTWAKDYILSLHDRKKWQKTERDLAIDDLVILADESTSRDEWRLGRIVAVDGTDTHVRKASIRRADGKIVERDRTRIVRLEIDE